MFGTDNISSVPCQCINMLSHIVDHLVCGSAGQQADADVADRGDSTTEVLFKRIDVVRT